jgi:hypothetical protein
MSGTAAQTAEVPRRRIPQPMWEDIHAVEKLHAHPNAWVVKDTSLRQELITVGDRYGFSETELIKRGIITPRKNPNPEGGQQT